MSTENLKSEQNCGTTVAQDAVRHIFERKIKAQPVQKYCADINAS